MTKTCEICGDVYEAYRANQKFCPTCGRNPDKARIVYAKAVWRNKIHAGEHEKKPLECVCSVCGKAYVTYSGRVSYCSDDCYHTYLCSIAKCLHCGKLLQEAGIRAEKGYCSDACREAEKLEKAKREGRYRACKQCGKLFVAKQENGKFCSRECCRAYEKSDECKAERARNKAEREQRSKQELERIQKQNKWLTKELESFVEKNQMLKESRPEHRPERQEEKQHLCTECRQLQSGCERFTSAFRYLPLGAQAEQKDGKLIVWSCPKYIGKRERKKP